MNAPPPVSAVVPTKNEEANLPRCLQLLKVFTEVIVVDSGSTDRTVEIAEAHGADIVDFEWNGRAPKKRNWCLRTLDFSNPWVLFIDADEYVSDQFVEELAATLESTPHNGFWLTYHNVFLGQLLKHGDPFRKIALVRLGCGEYEDIEEDEWSSLDMEVHEHAIVKGSVGRILSPIIHQDFKGMKAYCARHNEYSSWEARRFMQLLSRDAQNREHLNMRQRMKYRLLDSWYLGPLYFVYSYIAKLGFLDGFPGFVFAMMKMFYFLQIKAKLHEERSLAETVAGTRAERLRSEKWPGSPEST